MQWMENEPDSMNNFSSRSHKNNRTEETLIVLFSLLLFLMSLLTKLNSVSSNYGLNPGCLEPISTVSASESSTDTE